MHYFPPAGTVTGLNGADFQKQENGTWKVFVEHKNSKALSKQVSLKNRSRGLSADVDFVLGGTPSFYAAIRKSELKKDWEYENVCSGLWETGTGHRKARERRV